jgi:mRNA interferase RelE/StbE
MSFQVLVRKQVLKELERIPKFENRKIFRAIELLAHQPRPAGCRKLKGEREAFWRIRCGDYRIVYLVNDKLKTIDIRKIRHRREIYE